jgi:p21-activated kinase 1
LFIFLLNLHKIAYQAVKFYNYSIKKKDNVEPFKPFITEEAIVEESNEIEEFLNAKNAHTSEDSFTTDSSEENLPHHEPQLPPELPPPLPKKSATLPPQQKPALLPKPQIYSNYKPNIKPPIQSRTHKAMEDLRLIDDKEGSEVNDNNIDNHSKSTIVTKNTDFSSPDKSNNNTSTFILRDSQTLNEDEPVLRTKNKTRTTKSDEEVYKELRSICNLTNPLIKYSKLKEVGKGASGVVFIALDLESQKQVAIKTIDLKNQSSKELILNEIRVLSDFNHKNLVNFLEAYYLEDSDTLWVILEYMNG